MKLTIRQSPGRKRLVQLPEPPQPLRAVTVGQIGYDLVHCPKCPGNVRLKVQRGDLAPGQFRFNNSVLDWHGRLLMAYRVGRIGSRLHLAELYWDTLQPIITVPLAINHDLCRAGQEDPRLFIYNGNLHIGFIGVEVGRGQTRTHQMYAALGEGENGWRVGEVFAPHYHDRQHPKEKNWVFFEWQGLLLAVYRCGRKHVILNIDGDKAGWLCETESPFPWIAGEPRGGASPVLLGEEYYHWFHGTHYGDTPFYTGGLYTFEAKLPFRVKRLSRNPLLLPGDKPDGFNKKVVFPCGAVVNDMKWLVSYGHMDGECRIAEFDLRRIEEELVSV